ncbi:GGDEF domain-containing protein [Mycoplana ramosa]|uniref:GGDEF domain-containing protein n=1 Tax=Mycoplana ramosa TaxID=40837 RepID=A0ABW3YZU6_MYCRA
MNAKVNASETLARSAAVMAKVSHLMTRLEIPAIPRNYALLHEALTGSNTALGREITALGKAPPQEALDAIGVRHGLPDHNSLVLGHSATDLMRTIEALTAEAEAERQKRTNALTQINHLLGKLKADPVMAMSDFAGQADLLVSAVEALIGSESAHCQRLEALVARLENVASGAAASETALLHDPVTGLANRAALMNRLLAAYDGEDSTGSALLLMRVDRLKNLSDSHAAGASEEAVKQIATLFRKSIKKLDFVARVGGDGFAFLFEKVDRDSVFSIAERIRNRIEAEVFRISGREYLPGTLSLTIGAAFTEDAPSSNELYRQAMLALDAANESGTCVYSLDLSERAGRNYRRGAA